MAEALPSEILAIVATIDPDNYASGNGTSLSDAIDMQFHDRVTFFIQVGKFDNAKDGTVDFKVKESDAAAGTYHLIAGKYITQKTEHGSTDDNSQAVVNVMASELSAGHRYVKGALVVGGTDTVDVAVLALASSSRFSDAVTSTSFGGECLTGKLKHWHRKYRIVAECAIF